MSDLPADPDPDIDEEEPKKPLGSGGVIAWGLGLFFACRLLEIFLEAQATASAVGQAVLVEWGTSRLGVVWSDPKKVEPSVPELAKRAMSGTSAGLIIALAVVAVLRATGAATIESVPNVAIPVFVIGLITAALHAWRDELLLHGVVLRATPDRPDLFRIGACALTSGAAALGRTENPAFLLASVALGAIFGALWIRGPKGTGGGAWLPVGANAAFQFALGTIFAGGVVQLRVADGRWAGGDDGVLGGFAAAVALLAVAAVVIVLTLRQKSSEPAQVG